ncbi:uncharacterized protein ATC70_001722 [Mucor velutinosus]|uniref:Phorbol-ester/DAG-type domain-containing protein n=1 Tax=Mucor velutinosus TaxID=708070 RepID=A0AAN7DKP6_9FUNG|nr:hypothetical protein ATC70_001722 [Mucor velutinosus]
MPNSTPNSRFNATIINIHSPNDEIHSVSHDESFRRTSNASSNNTHNTATRQQQQPPPKPSPKVEEYRKMIQHIIGKILKRKRPPTALFHLSELCRTTQVSDQFENDDTIDLLIQLRSALMVCHQVGLSAQVLMQGERTPSASPASSRANSPAPSPRTGSPAARSADGPAAASSSNNVAKEKRSEFETILYVLGDLVLNDSRFKTANPKPSRPPYTMQTILIDIALLLVQIRDDSTGLYHIGTVFLPAFEAFSDGNMLGKLLSLFLDSLLPKLMKLKDEPNKPHASHLPKSSTSFAEATPRKTHNPNTPTINIQSPEPDQAANTPMKMSHLTIDTRPYSIDSTGAGGPSSPHSPHYSPAAQSSTHSSIQGQSTAEYHAYALFTPLLFFMIQYLDPYLAAQPTKAQQDNLSFSLTKQANSIHNFHRALSFMMSCKPDLYLDILDVISHSSSEVKFRACQILLYYYFVSVGHVMVADPLPLLGTREELEVLDQHREQQEFEEQRQKNHQYNRQHPTYQQQQQHNHRPHLMRHPSTVESLEEDDVEDHHVWYPYMFDHASPKSTDLFDPSSSSSSSSSNSTFPLLVHDDMNEAFCKECFKLIKGFGLRCYQCKGSVHYNCSSAVADMKEQGLMFYVKAGGIQKVVTPQYCNIPPQPRFRDMVNRGILGWTIKSNASRVGLLGHMFQLVNLYTLTICACCGLPLWDITQQGYHCMECNRFVHVQCLAEAEEVHGFRVYDNARSSFQVCVPYQPLLESDIQIAQSDLSKSLCAYYGDALPTSAETLDGRSFEEVGTMLNVLVLQDHILHCGVAAGCILITHESDDPLLSQQPQDKATAASIDTPLFKLDTQPSHCAVLTRAIQLCSDYLASGKCFGSVFLTDFCGNKASTMDKYVLSKEEYLGHLSAMIKCLMTNFDSGSNITAAAAPPLSSPMQSTTNTSTADKRRSAGDARGFLQVSPNPFAQVASWEDDQDDDFSEGHVPHESLDRSMLLSWLMTNLNFKSRKAAEILLQHMRNLGFFERFDASPMLFPSDDKLKDQQDNKAVQIIFPVPYAIDCSAHVESLINSIEACLQDVDLSINECGLLLLVRRCWPDPFMSTYTRERLIHAIVGWIFDEDERLLALHAELTSSKSPHHVHAANKQQNKWAQAALLSRMKGGSGGNPTTDRHRLSTFRHTTTAGVSSGASSIYVTTRAALRDRYIVRWMATIHDMDKDAYTDILFNAMEEIVDNKYEECAVPNWGETHDTKKHVLQKYEQLIGYVLKLKTNGLTFDSLDSILQQWLERTHMEFSHLGILQEKEPMDMRHLAKLCSTRVPLTKSASSVAIVANPIDIIMAQFDAGDTHSIDRGMRWLTLVTHSGTGIPSNSLSHIARLMVAARTPLDITAEFVKILWFQAVHGLNMPTPRAAVIDIIGYLNEIALDTLQVNNESQLLSDQSLTSAQTFIKYSAALACFAYNCPLKHIVELGIVPHVGDRAISNAAAPHSKRTTLSENSVMMQADEKTPLIQCMLRYLRFDQLNVRQDVIKMFYGLFHWGLGISNKDEFMAKCMPQLIPCIWELLTPTHDYLSDINLGLLMKLISVDVRYFQACVFKIFEDANWEVRYQGLDNLFGLFTKMDAAFQTEWLKLLSHLGPVFSYFVGCLWDKEEYVRSKAYALIRTFGTLHLRSAFRCWEAYFLTATDRQKMSLVSLMTQLNALFPDWQVLQWESLLEALEMKTPVDILDEYTRSPSSLEDDLIKDAMDVPSNNEAHHHHDQESAESENVKVLMLTLALQMLSNHLSIEPAQIARLKFILVQQMNFQNCQLFNDGGEITVEFGLLQYNPKDPARVAVMISCIRGLKKIMDSFAPLPAETVAAMASDSLEQSRMNLSENSSPGVHFIDVVLKMMNSGIDLTKLGHMMLKAWLEIVLIVVYKHNILDREYEQHIVTCMKQIIDLLTEDVSEENKLLILEILKCLLRRSDHLTAMVLSKQILALGKLMTKLGVRNSEPVYLKAKQFLKSAFLRFAVAGLFVLMFKNQTVSDANAGDVDLFFVLRTVIDPDDVIPDEDVRGEIIYLRDQPVRDVLDKLMKQQMERKAFSTVLHNTSRYVETVHTHPYSENILNDYAGFIHALIKHTTDWRRSDWNINPVFTMSAILLKEHPYHHAILLPPIQAIFKHGLSHCAIQPEAVVKLMAAYSAIATIPGAQPSNVFVDIMMDELKHTIANVSKPNKDTLLVLLQLVLWDTKANGQAWYTTMETSILGDMLRGHHRLRYFDSKLLELLPFFVGFMKRASTSQQFTKKDFKVYSCIAQLIVAMCLKDPKLMVIIFGYLKLEDGTECLRFLNWFILTLLRENADTLLYDMLGYEVVLTELLVRTFNTVEVDFHTPDLNFSYNPSSEKLLLSFLLLKSYVLLKLRSGNVNNDNPIKTRILNPISFWLTLWPALRRLLDLIEPSTLFMSGNVGLSVWNMFLSLLQFLFASRSEVVMINAYEWSDLLDDLLKKLDQDNYHISHQDNGGMDHVISLDDFRKQVTKLKAMFDVPPIEVPAAIMINQLFLEMRDVMRLQAESIQIQGNNRALMQTISPTF